MKAGDTFFLKKDAADRHLRVIISDPEKYPEQVIFVTMTSYDVTKEKVCLIQPGEHPWVKNLTCIAYDRIALCRAADLEKMAEGSTILWGTPVAQVLLSRIREGASLSRDIKPTALDILLDQGVLD
jgi:hypothetical protein